MDFLQDEGRINTIYTRVNAIFVGGIVKVKLYNNLVLILNNFVTTVKHFLFARTLFSRKFARA